MERDGLASELIEPLLADDVAGEYHHGREQALAGVHIAHPRAGAQGLVGLSWPGKWNSKGAMLVSSMESAGQGSEPCG